MGFSRQEYWRRLPFRSPGDLPDPGIEPESLASPALTDGFWTTREAPLHHYVGLAKKLLGFSVTGYGKIWMKVLANPIHLCTLFPSLNIHSFKAGTKSRLTISSFLSSAPEREGHSFRPSTLLKQPAVYLASISGPLPFSHQLTLNNNVLYISKPVSSCLFAPSGCLQAFNTFQIHLRSPACTSGE